METQCPTLHRSAVSAVKVERDFGVAQAKPHRSGRDDASGSARVEAWVAPAQRGRRLRAGETRAFFGRPGHPGVRVIAGEVWVTQENDDRDYVLSAGREFVPGRKGKVVVQALTHSTVMIGDAG
ncbi:MAG: DUF2917 domain-containing protein [Tepidisphaeraceae bacterium]